MDAVTRLDTAQLFSPLHAALMELLSGLAPQDWDERTLARDWRVRDVAAHLLDTQLRKLSAQRDGHRLAPGRPIAGYDDVVALINDLNSSWVGVARRLSPRVLVDLLAVSGPAVAEYVATLDPDAPAPFAVAWAGESSSPNWFDTGREYTEWWHHQMQIRDAVGAPLLLSRRFLHPLLDLSVRAFPRAYDGVAGREGATVLFEVSGDGGGAWTVVQEEQTWRVFRGAPRAPGRADATVRVDADTSWRLLFNALTPAELGRRVAVEGDRELAAPLLRARSVMV